MSTKNLGNVRALISSAVAPTNKNLIWQDTSVIPYVKKIWNNSLNVWEELSATGGGEANTASSVGTGESVYKEKVGVDLRFKSIKAGNNVSVVSNANEVVISSTGGGTIAMDAVPTAGSTNAVQSGGVKTELDKKQDSKVIEQMFKVNSTTDVGEFSCDVPFKINTITPQSGLMVTCKTSAGVVYTPGATVAAFDFLTFQGDTLGKTFVVKGERV